MPLETGTTLGPYQIDAPLGAGGMGEVYKATDTRLDRTVAIKVLPEHVAADPDLKQRFEREAKTISSLNHPHICTLHDIGNQDGIDFLVMEYLDGETLAQRLEKGALPLDQALTIAIEIADALDKAHRQGIVHRDLKPGNIMLTKSGAKLLDFGLAKLKPAEQPGGLSALPTQPADLTQEGAILGTFQYMAPEQLEGQEADARTDIFAFGTVIYEMVAGRKAFEGKSQASLIAAIMHVDPPAMSSLQMTSTPALDHVVKTCLIKDPDGRWQTAGDVGRQLQWISESGSPESRATAVAAVPQGAAQRHVLPSVFAAVVTGVVIGAAVWFLKPQVPPSPRPIVRFAVTPPALTITSSTVDLTISPDGTHIVNGTGPQNGGLVVRALDQLEATRYQELGPASSPFMSPDSASIGFASSASGAALPSATSGGVLQRVSVLGGPAVTICSLPSGPAGLGASWGRDDTIIFGTGQPSGLWRVSAGGGEPEVLTTLNTELGEVNHNWPDILPGGRAVLFTVIPAGPVENAQIAVLDLETGTHTVLVSGGSHPRYSHTGHIVYGAGGTLRAVGFDLDRLEVTSNAFPVLDGVSTKATGAANFSFSRDGTLVYVPSTSGTQRFLVWVDRDGREEPLALDPGRHNRVRVSPDGTGVAVEVSGTDTQHVWVSAVARGNLSILAPDLSRDEHPLWTLDGEYVVIRSDAGLFLKAADGSGVVESLLADENMQRLSPHDWSPDGNQLIFSYVEANTGRDIGVLAMEGERPWRPFLNSAANEDNAALSPNGRWIAYTSDETGQPEVYVERFPDLGNREQISTGGGRAPVWSPDGSELFYRDLNGSRMLAVPVDTEPALTLGTPAVVFEGTYLQAGTRTFDLAPDGRFLMIKLGEASTLPQIVVVENWLDELQRLVPTP